MALYAQLFLNTVQIGAVYVLFSLGLTIIFGVMKVVNFAHGELFATAALVVAALVPVGVAHPGLSIFVAYVAGLAAALLGRLAAGRRALPPGFPPVPARHDRVLHSFAGLSAPAPGHPGRAIHRGAASCRQSPNGVGFLGARVTLQRLVTCAVALALAAVVVGVIKVSKLGMALRAVAEDHEAAMLQGIKYDRIAFLGFLAGANLAAVAGCLIAPLFVVTPFMGADYLVRAFVIVIIGGLGSISGTVLASFVVALLDNLGGYFFDPTTTTIAMFALVMLLLVFRPQGLLGRTSG